MKKSFLLSAAFAMSVALQGWALPANPNPITITQPDGSTITVVMNGDEYGSYMTTMEGHLVHRGADGYVRYSRLNENNLIEGSIIARNGDNSKPEVMEFLQGVDREALINHFDASRNVNRIKINKQYEGKPMRRVATTEEQGVTKAKGLVILAQFQDVKFSENGTKENFEKLFNEEGNNYMGAIGSARDYFLDQSFGKFDPTFDVIGPVTLPNDEAYYGAPEDGYSSGDNAGKVYYLPLHALDAAYEEKLCNFADYDCNADGYIDLVFVVYAGYAESDGAPANTIWPHAAWVDGLNANKDRIYDGVKADSYACSSELAGTSGTDLYGIGAICHEFSHTLGLPDWYDTTGGGCFGMSRWSVMDQGCHNADARIPCGYNAYEREYCGWMEITKLTTGANIEMENVATSATAYKIVSDNNPDRYYTIETRVRSGWDEYLPAEGILIIKVDYEDNVWKSNNVNVLSSRQRFQFVAADNKYNMNSFETDLWPYGMINEFSENSTPKMKIHLSKFTDKPLTNIAFNTETKVGSFQSKEGTGVHGVTNNNDAAYFDGECIRIKSDKAESVSIYNVQGMLLATLNVENGEATYRPSQAGVFMVHNGKDVNRVHVKNIK